MKTKEEVIKEAWGIHWNKMDKRGQEQALEDNGYCHKNYVNSEIDFEIEVHKYPDVDFIRPKSLQGIENNNGWIRIESEANLPKTQSITEEIHCFIKSSDNEIIGMGKFSFGSFKTFFGNNYENVTHYQPIVKPNKPLY